MQPLERLQLMLRDMEQADPLYRPTRFWESGLAPIVRDLEQLGFESFRAHPSAHFFYVPLFARRSYLRSRGTIDRVVRWANVGSRSKSRLHRWYRDKRGLTEAQRDYDVLVAADTDAPPRLTEFRESDVGDPIEHVTFDGRVLSRSALNYLRGLAFLKKRLAPQNWGHVLEIGGGFGTLGEILLKSGVGRLYVDVDIPPVAAVSSYYLSEVFGHERVLTYEQSREMERIDLDAIARDYRAAVLCPWQLPRVVGQVDGFLNFISFQEMEPKVVENYIRLVTPLTQEWVLLRNNPKGKPIAGGKRKVGVLEPTTTDAMIESFEGFELVGRGGSVFGQGRPDGTVQSDVLCLRRSPAAG